MKHIAIIILLICIKSNALAQKDAPKKITPAVLSQINASVENALPEFKKRLTKKDYSSDEIEFAVDTFRLKQIAGKRMAIDYSTLGTNNSVDDLTDGYDKLMNKYYNKLLTLLKPEDKKILIAAQRAWLIYRDTESKLSSTMAKQEYSGGGTIQSNFISSRYSYIVVARTEQIFRYYDDAIKAK